MILNKYQEVMEHLTVSEEMKNRILSNLSTETTSKKKILVFPKVKRYVALVACLAILLVGAFAANQFSKKPVVNPPTDTDGIDTAWGSTQYSNADALSRASGIPIKELSYLPFKPTTILYQDYKNNLVEITYSDDSQSITYRVSKGKTDNSGDYNEYKNVYTKTMQGMTVTLKGEAQHIYLILFEHKGYSYSISSSNGLTEKQVENFFS